MVRVDSRLNGSSVRLDIRQLLDFIIVLLGFLHLSPRPAIINPTVHTIQTFKKKTSLILILSF